MVRIILITVSSLLYLSCSSGVEEAKKACMSDNMEACYEVAVKSYVSGDTDMAKKFAKKACEGKHLKACLKLAEAYEKNRNASGAKRYYQKACKAGDDRACTKAK